MSIYLHVGQCGVQIGEEFWNKISKYSDEDKVVRNNLWAHGGGGEPQAMFIDAERKVVRKVTRSTKRAKTGLNITNSSVTTRRGCGSNFAMGFNYLPHVIMGDDVIKGNNGFGQCVVDERSPMLEACLERIRSKVERLDAFSGFIGVHSSGGGTGAGFGARLCQELNDIYPTAYRLWNVITPYTQGESPTQHYNQLLSVSTIHENADALVLFNNDDIGKKTMKNINETIADNMISMYLPVTTLSPPSGGISTGPEPWEMIRSLSPIPSLKLLQTRHLVADNSNDPLVWEKLTRSLISQFPHVRSTGTSCISALCVCRGIGKGSSPNPGLIAKKLKKSYNCVKWNPFPIDVWMDHRNHRKSISVCANLTSSGRYIEGIVDKSRLMYDSGAYLHWYSRYGMECDDFKQSFEILRRVANGYRDAGK
uniref:tubulin delta chain n=1 Tax=Ciona intestinalis TaxID=7719 RepID=UPI000180B37F|nr:tubulin delta chain [Ciona intestinalis]|eukprot:XP_002121850.1 tubulin delta chain [Ciona intestinalis]